MRTLGTWNFGCQLVVTKGVWWWLRVEARVSGHLALHQAAGYCVAAVRPWAVASLCLRFSSVSGAVAAHGSQDGGVLQVCLRLVRACAVPVGWWHEAVRAPSKVPCSTAPRGCVL